jgi:FKBP-type peptidyl-prolyl cis-trans isomerase FkpA
MKIKRKINLRGQLMNKALLIVLLFSAFLSACSKVNSGADVVSAQNVKDVALINKYLQNNNIKALEIDSAGIATGIYYKIDTAGAAGTLYTSSTQITVAYTGWLLTTNAALGPVVGQSFQTGQQFYPSFVLGEVLSGWQLGIENSGSGLGGPVGLGGAITLYLPSKYAYGPYNQPTLGIPANSVLIFHIILYNVTN